MRRKIFIPPALYALIFYVLFIVLCIVSLKKMPLLSAPILFSVIVYYLFSPIVNFFERKTKLPRGIIAGVLILLLVILFVFLIVNAFPYLVSRLDTAAQKLPGVIKQFSESVKVFGDYLTRNFSEYIGKVDLMGAFSDWLNNSLSELAQILIKAFGSIYGILSLIVYLVLVPLFSFYFIKDQGKIEKTFYGLVPEAYRWRMRRKMIKK